MSTNFFKSKEPGMPRRAFLGGAGTVVALPILESLLPRQARAQSAAAAAPKRLIYYYVPNGIVMQQWKPTTVGATYTMPPILKPLEHLRADFMIVSGLANFPAFPDGGNGDHGAGTASFATAAHANKSETVLRLGASADQLAASVVGKNTRIPSMQLGMDAGRLVGGCDNGYGCAYSNSISWASATQPLTKINRPQTAFDLLFQGSNPTDTQVDQARRRIYKQSVLDRAIAQAKSLSPKLGTTDRRKLDEYLTGVQEVERQVRTTSPVSCASGVAPAAPATFEASVKLFADIMVLAMQCDVTRIFSFMFGDAGSVRTFPQIGITRGHHDISHHGNVKANLDALQAIDTYEIQMVDYLATKMKNTPDGDKDLLFNSTLFFSSDVSDGNSHSHNDMPVLVAGHGGGMLNTGQHFSYPLNSNLSQGTKFGNMLATTIRTVGATTAVGNSDGILPETLKTGV